MTHVAPLRFAPRTRPLLLYILGWGRSGSSILANILGSLDGAASLGEVRYLWDRGVLENGICGCGADFDACTFWPGLPMGAQRLGGIEKAQARDLARCIGSGARRAQIPALHSRRMRAAYVGRNRAALADLMALYAAAFEQSGARVLVDASKSPFYAVNFLTRERPFDIAFLHLVRDPRAVLHSWRKLKQREDGAGDTHFPRYSAARSLAQWTLVNSRCNRFADLSGGAYAQIRYEDFAEDWAGALLDGAGDLFDPAGPRAPGASGLARVEAQHSISGNPSRFSLGEVRLKPDQSWQEALSAMDRRLAALISGPVARGYGYRIG